MRVIVITPPGPVVTWEEAQAHLRLDGDDEKPIVEAMIAAATAHIDGPSGWLGRAIGAQVLEARFGAVTIGQTLQLPYPPIVELMTISYLDSADAEHTAQLDNFELFCDAVTPKGGRWIWEGGSLRRDAARIRYRAGYDEVPAPIKAALLLMVGDFHRFRSTASDTNVTPTSIPMSATVSDLLQPYRVYR